MSRKVVCLVPCNGISMAVSGFFERENIFEDISCTPFEFIAGRDIKKAPAGKNDRGVWRNAHNYLAPLKTSYEKAIILVDAQFPGSPGEAQIKADIRSNMESIGWGAENFVIVVLTPELEVLLWPGNDDLLTKLVRFDPEEKISEWLISEGWEFTPQGIPLKPKEALKALIGRNRTGRNVKHALVCKNFAKLTSIENCVHSAFNLVSAKVREWFPLEQI